MNRERKSLLKILEATSTVNNMVVKGVDSNMERFIKMGNQALLHTMNKLSKEQLMMIICNYDLMTQGIMEELEIYPYDFDELYDDEDEGEDE